jgi:long-subunit fatty acid transport protein
MSTSDRFCGQYGRGLRPSGFGIGFLVGVMLALASASAFAAGIEHPDIGTIAIGRGGAYAAAPTDGLAMQYNPAGFASQHGWRLTLDANMSFQQLSFAPATGGATVSNSAGGFLVGAPIVSYGFGHVGRLSSLTLALGFTTPSAIGKENYPGPPATPDAAQRYALIASDYFIIYYSAAIAASYKWFSAGVTLQLVHGSAQFSQAAWSGPYMGTDTFYDAIAHVDVSNTVVPTAVFGVTARPIPKLALGLSYRPRFDFIAHGTLKNDLPPVATALGVTVVGNSTDFFLRFPDVIRFGAQYVFLSRLLVEADVVAELWSEFHTIEIRPKNIHVTTPGTDRTLANIIFQKDFQDAISVRVGADYELLPSRLTVRAGYLHETSAIPLKSVNVDFGNWQRDAVSVGGTVKIWRGLNASVAYAHHFIADQNVTDSQVVQIVTPCSTPGCTDPAPTVVGKGVYKASLDVVSLSLGVILDDFRARP